MLPRFLLQIGRAAVIGGVAVLGACGDATTAPKSPTVQRDQTASGVVLKVMTFASIRVVDVNEKKIPEATAIRFIRFNSSFTALDTVVVDDNSAADMDASTASIKVALNPSFGIQACVAKSTAHYAIGPNVAYAMPCTSRMSSLNQLDMGMVYMRKFPTMTFKTEDMFGNTIVGAMLSVPSLGLNTIATDGGFNDDPSVLDGELTVVLRKGQGAHTWCEVKAPTKFAITDPSCGSFTAAWDKAYIMTLKHEHLVY